MWFNFLGTLHLSRDIKRWRWRLRRLRVVTRVHVEGLGLLRVDQGQGAHSDGKGQFGSTVPHGAGRRTPLSQTLMSSDLSFHIPSMRQPMSKPSANPIPVFSRLL